MKVLMISTDRKIFDKNSDVAKRMISYGNLFDFLEIIVFSLDKKESFSLSEKVKVHSTNSMTRFNYVPDAIKIGKKINNVDIITSQDPFETGLAGFRISKKINAKLHIQIHTDLFSPNFLKHSTLNRIRIGIAKNILKKADGIRVVSERIKKDLLKMNLKADITVLPIWVDSEKFSNNEKQFDLHNQFTKFENIILTVARLESEKNISLEIDIMKELVKTHPKTTLIVVGDGSLKDSLIDKARKLGLEDNIFFISSAEHNLISAYYKTADIYLQSSLYEGFGLTLLEAAYSGLPIVSTDVGLIGSILEKDESVFIFEHKDEALDYLKRLLDNPVLRESLGERTQESANRFKMTKEEYLEKYKKSLEI